MSWCLIIVKIFSDNLVTFFSTLLYSSYLLFTMIIVRFCRKICMVSSPTTLTNTICSFPFPVGHLIPLRFTIFPSITHVIKLIENSATCQVRCTATIKVSSSKPIKIKNNIWLQHDIKLLMMSITIIFSIKWIFKQFSRIR